VTRTALEPHKIRAMQIRQIADLTENMGCRDQPTEPTDQAEEGIEVLDRKLLGALELKNPFFVDQTDKEQHQQVGIDQNASGSTLLDKGASIQHLRHGQFPNRH
jgi:hypothetical protein